MAWNPRTWVALEKISAAKLNTIRDSLKMIGDPWTAYTPVWTASTTNPTLGNGTLNGRFMQAGQLVTGNIDLVFGSTTTLGTGNYSWTLPTNAQNFRYVQGSCEILDTSAATIYPRCILPTNANTIAVADFTPVRLNNAGPIPWAAGDRISIGFSYEAA